MKLFDREHDSEALEQTAPRGMTLVEVMIVITILASIMGVVGVYVFGALNQAQSETARLGIKNLSNKVETYYLMSSPKELPDNLNELTEGQDPLIKDQSKLKDPWGNKYIYNKKGSQEFKIYSAGPDGSRGTEDDVHKKAKDDGA